MNTLDFLFIYVIIYSILKKHKIQVVVSNYENKNQYRFGKRHKNRHYLYRLLHGKILYEECSECNITRHAGDRTLHKRAFRLPFLGIHDSICNRSAYMRGCGRHYKAQENGFSRHDNLRSFEHTVFVCRQQFRSDSAIRAYGFFAFNAERSSG